VVAENEFDGRVALLTGAGTGIGHETARRLAAGGATVVITDKHQGRLDEAVASIGGEFPDAVVVGHLLDIERRGDFDRVFAAVENDLGPIRIYVWNAALNVQQPIFDHDPELFDRILYANVNNCWYSCVGVVDQMRRAGGGSIVMIGSIAPDIGATEREPPYALSKAAVRALVGGIVKAGGPINVRCNEVIMGMVDGTRFTEMRPERAAAFAENVPMGRNASKADIAEAVAFLASDRASFITGEIMNVTGGYFVRL
jgi:NAD(P)-dependent dehydrogenase (short-subunit alcohol dehydrogenase family)